MTRASPAERLLSFVSVAGVVVAIGLAGRVRTPAGGDDWTDGAAGARLWALVGLVPAVAAGLVAAHFVASRRGGLRPLVVCHVPRARDRRRRGAASRRPPGRPRSAQRLGAGLDVAGRRRSPAGCWRPCCGREPLARWCRSPPSPARQRRSAFGIGVDPTTVPRPLPAVSPLQVPSLDVPRRPRRDRAARPRPRCRARRRLPRVVAVRRQHRRAADACAGSPSAWWPASASSPIAQLVRLLGLVEVGDGLLVGPAAGSRLGGRHRRGWRPRSSSPSSVTPRRRCAGSPSGSASCRSSAPLPASPGSPPTRTTAAIIPTAPAIAAVLTVAALVLPVQRLARAHGRPLVVRRDRQRRPAHRRLRRSCRARQPRRSARPARRHVPARRPAALGQGVDSRARRRSSP